MVHGCGERVFGAVGALGVGLACDCDGLAAVDFSGERLRPGLVRVMFDALAIDRALIKLDTRDDFAGQVTLDGPVVSFGKRVDQLQRAHGSASSTCPGQPPSARRSEPLTLMAMW